ncbi:MAG: hypothetical protein K2W94_07890 [Alphaproteobacteria bacterium]|nr:hypothetical protein [Alphaproteobacteria bacterium]
MRLFLVILSFVSTLNAMETAEDGINAAEANLPKPGSTAVLHLQIFEEILAIMEGRRGFNQELYDQMKDTKISVKDRVAEFEEKSGRRISNNKLIDRFKNYTRKTKYDLDRYNDLIPVVRNAILSTSAEERETTANYLYAYLQWTKKGADSALLADADEDFYEIKFYQQMISSLERLPISDAYKSFSHYITIRGHNSKPDKIECPEYTQKINTSIQGIAKIHGPLTKAVHVLLEEMQANQDAIRYVMYRMYIYDVQEAEVAYEELKKKYNQTLEALETLTTFVAVSGSFYSSRKQVIRNVPSIMREIQALEEMSKQYQSFVERFQSLLDNEMTQNVLNRLKEEEEEEMKKVQLTEEKNDRTAQIRERLRKKTAEKSKAQQTQEPMLEPAATIDESVQKTQATDPKKPKKKSKKKNK